jgi:hypothetical protein
MNLATAAANPEAVGILFSRWMPDDSLSDAEIPVWGAFLKAARPDDDLTMSVIRRLVEARDPLVSRSFGSLELPLLSTLDEMKDRETAWDAERLICDGGIDPSRYVAVLRKRIGPEYTARAGRALMRWLAYSFHRDPLPEYERKRALVAQGLAGAGPTIAAAFLCRGQEIHLECVRRGALEECIGLRDLVVTVDPTSPRAGAESVMQKLTDTVTLVRSGSLGRLNRGSSPTSIDSLSLRGHLKRNLRASWSKVAVLSKDPSGRAEFFAVAESELAKMRIEGFQATDWEVLLAAVLEDLAAEASEIAGQSLAMDIHALKVRWRQRYFNTIIGAESVDARRDLIGMWHKEMTLLVAKVGRRRLGERTAVSLKKHLSGLEFRLSRIARAEVSVDSDVRVALWHGYKDYFVPLLQEMYGNCEGALLRLQENRRRCSLHFGAGDDPRYAVLSLSNSCAEGEPTQPYATGYGAQYIRDSAILFGGYAHESEALDESSTRSHVWEVFLPRWEPLDTPTR